MTIFEKIIKKEIPAYIIEENDHFLAFLDINAVEEGHTVVVPKEKAETVWDVENIGEYMNFCKSIAARYSEITGGKVYSMIIGEDVPYAHIHIIPKGEGKILKAIEHIPKTNLLNKESKAKEIHKKFRFPPSEKNK